MFMREVVAEMEVFKVVPLTAGNESSFFGLQAPPPPPPAAIAELAAILNPNAGGGGAGADGTGDAGAAAALALIAQFSARGDEDDEEGRDDDGENGEEPVGYTPPEIEAGMERSSDTAGTTSVTV